MKLFLIMFAALLTSQAAMATNTEPLQRRGTALSFVCTGCHGTDGKSPGSVPAISVKDSAVFLSMMREYKSGQRTATIMDRVAKAYSDEELRILAAHFAAVR